MTRTSPIAAPRRWTTHDVPDLTGRTFVVTGANSGLGQALTRELARHGAKVIMAVRNPAAGEAARREIRSAHPRADLDVRRLDLLDLGSVHAFAAGLAAAGTRVDVLVNNAGIANVPHRLSPQGYESQFAVNHLGHFALTALLLDTLARGADPRVVTVSSQAYRLGAIPFGDFAAARRYSPGRAYADSKLANLLFGLELERRLRAAGSPVRSLVAHPGMARTPMHGKTDSLPLRLATHAVARVLGRPVEQGVLPLLYAATAPDAPAGPFIGPVRPPRRMALAFGEVRPPAADADLAGRLWRVSEELTGLTVGLEPRPAG